VTEDPYKSAENRAFWSRSVARDFEPGTTVDPVSVKLGPKDSFMSAGSCFASNVRRYLEPWGYSYTLTEPTHSQWPEAEETLYYEAFSARYGNVYTARQMVQLLQRAIGTFQPAEEYWETAEGPLIDPFRPGLAHRAWSVAEFRALTAQHLAAVRSAVERSSVLVFTLGLTEAWYSADDGAVFPACPGTVSGEFDPERHRFANFSVDEVTRDLEQMVEILRSINPSIRVIVTVSPVPLVATASGRHVLTATTYSKSVLRVAADQVTRSDPGVSYFPAYELVTGGHNLRTAFESDLRSVRQPIIDSVMSSFAAAFLEPLAVADPATPWSDQSDVQELVAQAVSDECEEMMADEQLGGEDRSGHRSTGAARSPTTLLRRLGSGRKKT
jgi:hypothetical protein